MSALVVLLLLSFLLIIAVSMMLWSALTLGSAPAPVLEPVEAEAPPPPIATAPRPSNDEVRGARASVRRSELGTDDAFERFVRSDRRSDGSDF